MNLAQGIILLGRKDGKGWIFLFGGSAVVGWAVLRLCLHSMHYTIDWNLPRVLDRYASGLGGAGLVLAILMLVDAIKATKARKLSSPNHAPEDTARKLADSQH